VEERRGKEMDGCPLTEFNSMIKQVCVKPGNLQGPIAYKHWLAGFYYGTLKLLIIILTLGFI
jgi:hypothetical protein